MGVITPKVKSITFGTSHPSGHGGPRAATRGDDEQPADCAERRGEPAAPAAATKAAASAGALTSAP
jgi:hypothetical protein